MTSLFSSSGQLERRTTPDEVADALRQAIVRGDFEDGEELNQVALARHFGVSRVPVREALRQLQAEGLISARAHMRAVVKGLTLDRVLEVLDLRMRVETYLLSRAAAKLTADDLDGLRKICDEMERVDSHPQWLQLNKAFHDGLYARSGAELAQDLSRQLAMRIERYLHLVNEQGVHRTAEANAEHRRILDALSTGGVDSACAELEVHIGRTRERVISLFAQRDGGAESPRTGRGA